MNIQKNALILMILLSFLAHGAALAKTETWDIDDPAISIVWRVTVFEEDMPDELRRFFKTYSHTDVQCYRGAMVFGLDRKGMTRIPGDDFALLALVEGEQRILYGMKHYANHGYDGWGATRLGSEMLLPGREFTITYNDPYFYDHRSLLSRFAVAYPRDDGGMESYGFNAIRRDYTDWYVQGYESVDAQGNGFAIINDQPDYGFRIVELPAEGPLTPGTRDNLYIYHAYVPLWPVHMNGITDFPTSVEDAIRVADASWMRFEGTDLAMAYGGVNLRTKASTSSRNLGRVKSGALVHVLGQEKGEDAPWYHVRLGREEGWISGRYVMFPGDEVFCLPMWDMPLPKARATEARTLRIKPDARAESVMELPKDAQMHVMMEAEDGWLYVMVPRGAISWEMDVDGAAGYIPADDVAMVVQGPSLSAVQP